MTFKYDHQPNCKKCRKDSVIADAGIFSHKPYYYCRNCKIELDFWGYEIVLPENGRDLTELDNYFINHPEMVASKEEKWPQDRSDEDDDEEDPTGYGGYNGLYF